ncbi:MAG: hypothetical protein ABJF50_24490 [Paracoccaceae bacterium]
MLVGANLTLLLGPQTRLALAINSIVRQQHAVLSQGGLRALPARLAQPLVRRNMDPSEPLDARREAFSEDTEGLTFLSAVSFLGPPPVSLGQRELLPEAERWLASLGELSPRSHLVLTIDRLPDFFIAAGSAPLERRVRATPWEVLYELSWSDLIDEILVALPDCKLSVLTPDLAAVRSPETLKLLFGDAAEGLPDPYFLLRSMISQTGRMVLDRVLAEGKPKLATLEELRASFGPAATPEEIHERLGIDKLTQTLLNQRFDEDLEAIGEMPGIEVL